MKSVKYGSVSVGKHDLHRLEFPVGPLDQVRRAKSLAYDATGLKGQIRFQCFQVGRECAHLQHSCVDDVRCSSRLAGRRPVLGCRDSCRTNTIPEVGLAAVWMRFEMECGPSGDDELVVVEIVLAGGGLTSSCMPRSSASRSHCFRPIVRSVELNGASAVESDFGGEKGDR